MSIEGLSTHRRYRCPVCWQNVAPTHQNHIGLHWDSIGRAPCPMSSEPFTLAQPFYPHSVYILRKDSGRRSGTATEELLMRKSSAA